MSHEQSTVLVAINDIFFYTKLRDALSPAGYKLDRVRLQSDAAEKATATKPIALVINMNEEKFDAFTVLKDIKGADGLANLPVLAFANHEQVETFRKAKELGVTKIVTRNEFSAKTRELFEEILSGQATGASSSDTTCH